MRVQGPPELPMLGQVGQAATCWLGSHGPDGACVQDTGWDYLGHFAPHLPRSSQSSQLPVEPAGISFTGLWCCTPLDLGHPYPGHQLLETQKPRDSGSIEMAPVSPFWGLTQSHCP